MNDIRNPYKGNKSVEKLEQIKKIIKEKTSKWVATNSLI